MERFIINDVDFTNKIDNAPTYILERDPDLALFNFVIPHKEKSKLDKLILDKNIIKITYNEKDYVFSGNIHFISQVKDSKPIKEMYSFIGRKILK